MCHIYKHSCLFPVDANQRRSSLLFHLGQAHSKISSLEDYIREREKQLRSAVHRFERTDSRSLMASAAAGSRLRRVGLSHNLLHMRGTMSQEEEEEVEGECVMCVFVHAVCVDDMVCVCACTHARNHTTACGGV